MCRFARRACGLAKAVVIVVGVTVMFGLLVAVRDPEAP